MEQMIKTREDAARAGDLHYYSGKPCKRGHDVVRLVATGACTACLKIHRKRHERKIKALIKEGRSRNSAASVATAE